jgi:hypothetical protein
MSILPYDCKLIVFHGETEVMETFDQPRKLTVNPHFQADRQVALAGLATARIDAPIREIVANFESLSCCFTLQSCYGHFVHAKQPRPENLEPLPPHDVGPVRYRIAYIALCIENSAPGRRLLTALADIPAIDRELIHFGSPTWFWERYVNSYALQVEPLRFLYKDEAVIDYGEALQIQQARTLFFEGLEQLIKEFV